MSMYMLPIEFETFALSPSVFGGSGGAAGGTEEGADASLPTVWYLRLCLFKAKPNVLISEINSEEHNVALLNAKVVAGKRQCIAGAMNIVRDMYSRRKATAPAPTSTSSSNDASNPAKKVKIRSGSGLGPDLADALESSLSSLLPLAMWPKKHGSAGAPHEKFFSIELLQENDPVFVARLDKLSPEQGGDASFDAIVRRLAATIKPEPGEEDDPVTMPLNLSIADKHRLEKAFDLHPSELKDIDKAITIRVAAKDCM